VDERDKKIEELERELLKYKKAFTDLGNFHNSIFSMFQ
jgi:hypothetical protein